jgi:hypothetical protein
VDRVVAPASVVVRAPHEQVHRSIDEQNLWGAFDLGQRSIARDLDSGDHPPSITLSGIGVSYGPLGTPLPNFVEDLFTTLFTKHLGVSKEWRLGTRRRALV